MSNTVERSPLLLDDTEHQGGINASASYQSGAERRVSVYEEYVRPVMGELAATLLFVWVGVMCVQFAAGKGLESPAAVAMAIAVGHGLTIALLVTAFGDISGGHINPAVTVGVAVAGGITPRMALLYIFAQLAGALAGAGLAKAVLSAGVYALMNGGAHTLGTDVSPSEGILCEVLLTTLLVLTVLLTAVDPKTRSPLAPLAIGLAVLVDILAGLHITGASMNPARSFGAAVVLNSSDGWRYHYIYWVGPLLGSLVAGVSYRLLFASGEKRLVFKTSS